MGLKMKKFRYLAILLSFVVSLAVAATPNPMEMLQNVSNQMVAALHQNKSRIKSNPKYVHGLVNRIVVPHADVAGMSRAVLGRNAWNSASVSARSAFQKAFKTVVINTYESALNAYTNETIKFDPMRGSYQDKKTVQVQSYVVRSDGPPVSLNYHVVLKGGRWLLYDLNVEGISMLQSFRAQFSSQISSGKSVGQIAQDLERRNAR